LSDKKSIFENNGPLNQLSGSIERIEELTFGAREYLLVGVARCAVSNFQNVCDSIRELMGHDHKNVFVYMADEIEFKKTITGG